MGRRLGRFLSTVYERYGVQFSLLALLLSAFYRANVLSLLYVLVVCGIYIFTGRRKLGRVWAFLTGLTTLVILWQYVIVLGTPPSREETLPWSDMAEDTARFFLLAGYNVSDLHFDALAFFFVALQLHYFRSELASPLPEGDATVVRRRAKYLPSFASGSEMRAAREARAPATGEAREAARVWTSLRFLILLLIDKLLIVSLIFIGTFRADLLSFGYVALSLRLLFRNYLYKGESDRYIHQWRNLAVYNLFVLALQVLYQVPGLPDVLAPAYPTSPIQWEDVIGLSRFRGGGWVGLTRNGGLLPILIFFLIDLQHFIFNSRAYLKVKRYYDASRFQARLKGRESARLRREARESAIAHYEELRIGMMKRLERILATIDKLESKFFDDNETWPTPPPKEWVSDNAQLAQLSVSACVLDRPFAPGKIEYSGNVVAAQDVVKLTARPANPNATVTVVSEITGQRFPVSQAGPTSVPLLVGENRLVVEVVAEDRSARREYLLRITREEPEEAVVETSTPPPTPLPLPASAAASSGAGGEDEKKEVKWADSVAADDAEAENKGAAEDPKAQLSWIRKLLIPHVDPLLWNEYSLDEDSVVLVQSEDLATLPLPILVWRCIASNSQWICFLAYIVTLLGNGDLLSLFIPCLLFIYGIVDNPRAPKGFWLFCLSYSAMMVTLKFGFQLDPFCVNYITYEYTDRKSVV